MHSTTARPGPPGDARLHDSGQKLEHSKPYPLKDTEKRIRFLPNSHKHEGPLAISHAYGKAQRNDSGFLCSIEATKPLLRKTAGTVASRHRG